jgi:hypothetical protein
VFAAVLPVDRVLAEQLLHNAQVKGFAVHEAVVDKLPGPLGRPVHAWPVPVTGRCAGDGRCRLVV